MARQEKRNFFRVYYDKIIVVVVLIALLLSLAILIRMSSTQREMEERFKIGLNTLSAKFEFAEETDATQFNATMAKLVNPYVIPAEGASLLVAAERVSCVNVKCMQPIPIDADVCKYCLTEQPPEDGTEGGWDSDGDGMVDEWESKYGLNPVDPSDASGDLDGDFFTNLEEFRAGTDPTDPKSRPPLLDFLMVDKIDAIPFPYVLRSRILAGASSSYTFSVNEILGNRTYFVKIGDEINASGYKAISHTNKMAIIKRPGVPDRKAEVPILRVSNGEESLDLQQGEQSLWNSFKVTFVCDKINGFEPIEVNNDDSFDFDGDSYTVVEINKDPTSNTGTVVIKQKSTQKNIKVPNK